MDVFALQNTFMGWLTVVLFVATVVALVDALTRRAEVFEAAGKLTKGGWVLLLVIAAGMEFLFGGGLGLFVGTIIMLVYWIDVRPAVAALTRRR